MKQIFVSPKVLFVLALVATSQLIAGPDKPVPPMLKGDIQLKSLTSIAFSKEGVLFLADPLGMKIYALDEKHATGEKAQSLDVANVDEKIAALLGVSAKDIKIEDMAVNPTSQEVYL